MIDNFVQQLHYTNTIEKIIQNKWGKYMLPVAGSPTRFNKSQIRADLIFISIGASQFREGLKFTSNSHGFKSESIRMSKP